MSAVTYLLGAGASANVLPVVANMPARLRNFRQTLDDSKDVPDNLRSAKGELLGHINWLHDSLVKRDDKSETGFIPIHSSIDTFAKKLYIKNDIGKLRTLKIISSLFFAFEQRVRGVDIRYDSFLASIIKKDAHALPGSLKVITWNYDSQIPAAYRAFQPVGGSLDVSALRLIDKHTPSPRGQIGDPNKFNLVQINGIAGLWNPRTSKKIDLLDDLETCHSICENYELTRQKESPSEPTLSFAWEDAADQFIPGICGLLSKTEILVIIGYSLPFFNREIDRQIVSNMRQLRRVYIQDLDPEGTMEKFLNFETMHLTPTGQTEPLSAKNIRTTSNVDLFILPNELSL